MLAALRHGLRPPRRGRGLVLVLAGLGAAAVIVATVERRQQAPTEPAIVDPESFTIYLLGGSTALGYPYYPKGNIGKITRLLVGGTTDGRRVRIVNLAGPGKTARVVLRDARDLAARSPPRGRCLAFLHTGNNEFTRFDRRHDLRTAERSLFDAAVVSDEERARVEAAYGAALEAIVSTLHDAGIPVVAANAAVNLKDWDPNRSVLADPSHADTMRHLLASGEAALAAGAPERALERFELALKVEPRFALASKRAGDCCRALGRFEEARLHYQNAVDHDGNPLRESSRLNDILRGICHRRRVPLVDAVRILGQPSPDSLLGFELLWDNCHPTLEGYVLLAHRLAGVIDSLFDVTPREASLSEVRASLGVDRDVEQAALNMEGQYCYVASTLTYEPKHRLERARFYLEQADALGPEAEVVCSLAVLSAMEGHVQIALEQWRRALALDEKVARGRMENRYVVQLMERLGINDLPEAVR